jgi:hypothetical protein
MSSCAVLPKSDTSVPVVVDPPIAFRYAVNLKVGLGSDTSKALVRTTL